MARAIGALPWYVWPAAAASVAFLALALLSAESGHVDWAGFWLTFVVLSIAVATLLTTLPTAGKLWVARQEELGVDDMIFYVYNEPPHGQVPRDILFQVHLAVANAGGRKLVLSSLRLEKLIGISGAEIRLPGLSLPVEARRIKQGAGWRIEDNVMHHHNFLEFIPVPHLLEPDDIITMQLRVRPCIDWSANWSVDRLRTMADALQDPVSRLEVRGLYRLGSRLVDDTFSIEGLAVLQQDLYRRRLGALTHGFASRPQVDERACPE